MKNLITGKKTFVYFLRTKFVGPNDLLGAFKNWHSDFVKLCRKELRQRNLADQLLKKFKLYLFKIASMTSPQTEREYFLPEIAHCANGAQQRP